MIDTNLIAADDIDYIKVNNPDGDNIGQIDHLMIDKLSGLIAYAVIKFDGITSTDDQERPIPWGKLCLDKVNDVYVTSITESQLKSSPRRNFGWNRDREWERLTHKFYSIKPYWEIAPHQRLID